MTFDLCCRPATRRLRQLRSAAHLSLLRTRVQASDVAERAHQVSPREDGRELCLPALRQRLRPASSAGTSHDLAQARRGAGEHLQRIIAQIQKLQHVIQPVLVPGLSPCCVGGVYLCCCACGPTQLLKCIFCGRGLFCCCVCAPAQLLKCMVCGRGSFQLLFVAPPTVAVHGLRAGFLLSAAMFVVQLVNLAPAVQG